MASEWQHVGRCVALLRAWFRWSVAASFLVSFALTLPALAAPWLPVGDRGLRNDFELLVDRGLLPGPVTTWPIPMGQLSALPDVAALAGKPEYVRMAAARLRDYRSAQRPSHAMRPIAELRATNRAQTVRDFGAAARYPLEIREGVSWDGTTVSARLNLGVPLDAGLGNDDRIAMDGTFLSIAARNLRFYGGWVDQWFGPGWNSSLLLSNNARPMPKIGIMREDPQAFASPWFSWLGPMQVNFVLGQLDGPRIDPNTMFASLRITSKPWRNAEIGLTRMTELCGDHHPCKPLSGAFDVMNDSKKSNSVNDQAGIDFRYAFDLDRVSVTPYVQLMNEDTGPLYHSYTSYLAGTSMVGAYGDAGASWRLTAEYTDSIATLSLFDFSKPQYGGAYNNYDYVDGFRYRDRTLGFSLDSDSRLASLSWWLTNSRGRQLRLLYAHALVSTSQLAQLQTSGNPARRNVVSNRSVAIHLIEAGVTVPWRGFSLDLSARAQSRQPGPRSGSLMAGEAGIRYGFW